MSERRESELHLIVGNRLYSSWSLRAGILLRAFGIEHRETMIEMYRDDTRERMLSFGPTGKVPVLVDGDITVWDSLAIIEHVADRFPDLAIWPREQAARSHARSASAEMHSGFTGLRGACPMNLTKTFEPRARSIDVDEDVKRVVALWREARERFGTGGPFLYGEFCAADAMYAPVVSRLETYGFDLADDTRAYMDAVLAHPAFASWRQDAYAETARLPHYEEGETVRQVLIADPGQGDAG